VIVPAGTTLSATTLWLVVRPVTATLPIVNVVLTPKLWEAADRVAPEVPTEMLLDVAGVTLLEVVTVYRKVPAAAGALAVKDTETLVPALMLQPANRKMLIPLAVAEPAPPLPAVPVCRQLPPMRSMLVGTDDSATEGTTVTEELLEPASAAAVVKVTVKLVDAPAPTEDGVALTVPTEPDGVPIV
jgi:hypothetical protein